MTEAERLKPKATLHSPISSVADLASELSGALIDCPLIDELAFLPSAAPTDVFGLDQCFGREKTRYRCAHANAIILLHLSGAQARLRSA
jgi:hypothetical protein